MAMASARGWPVWKQVVVGVAGLAFAGGVLQLPWRPALGLLGLLTLGTVLLAVDAWGLRSRVPLVRSENDMHVVVGWGLLGSLLLCVALLAVLSAQGRSAPAGTAASGLSSPSAGPTTTPPPAETPVPVVRPPSSTPTPTRVATRRRTPSPSLTLVTFLNGPLSAHRDQLVTLRVRTAPQTKCSIDIGYPSAPELDPTTSDASGNVSWSWRLVGPAPSGTWPTAVSCSGRSATTQIVVS